MNRGGIAVLLGAAAASAAPDAGPADAGRAPPATCIERLPDGKERPVTREAIPALGTSGHATYLVVEIEHGKGETVLPNGLRIDLAGDDAKAVESAGFVLPDPGGGARPTRTIVDTAAGTTTTLRVPVVPLPKEPGRQVLVLPPLPIAIERASGELVTLCTKPHSISIEDPIANAPNAEPRENPGPRRQPEVWTAARDAASAALAALVVGALAAWIFGRIRRRPKPQPPPPPPRPPWEVALEELDAIRHAGLIAEGRFAEHFDRVSDAVRCYLGGRYGYDGLESTTREALALLVRVVPPVPILPDVERFLRHADLVKFARLTPTKEECEAALAEGESIVNRTIPPLAARGAPKGAAA